MRNLLPALHDTHNGGLRFVIAISSNTFVGLLVFLLGLFGLDLIDFDAVLWMREIEVHGEDVAEIDVFAFGGLTEDAVPCAGEGLKGSLQFCVILNMSAYLVTARKP